MGAGVEILIDPTGRSMRAGRRDVALAIAKIGFIYIRSLGRTAIVTLQPRLVSQLTLAGAGYKIADLGPERTIIVAGVMDPECWVFPGYTDALKKLGNLVCGEGDGEPRSSVGATRYLV
jgi:hypothetical protein